MTGTIRYNKASLEVGFMKARLKYALLLRIRLLSWPLFA